MPTSSDRFTRAHPCPICGGFATEPHGRQRRCYGYQDSTGEYARCTREEHAGKLNQNEDSTYSHRLHGPCHCGKEHGSSRDQRETVYQLRDGEGKLIAEHVRWDASGDKRFAWRQNGQWKLNGTRPADMLYGAEHISRLPEVMPVLVEGEKAAEALKTAGVRLPLASVCGAPNAPSEVVLRLLEGRTIAIWPDNDEDGRLAAIRMRRNALKAGCAKILRVNWIEAPAKGDAADALAIGGRQLVRRLLKEAHEWTDEVSTENIPTPIPQPIWPDPMSADAFHGLAGRLCGLIDDYVESDQASVLVQFLTAFGVAAGLHPHFMVSATRHAPTVYIGLVGPTSIARKGTAWDPVETLFKFADAKFATRIMSGIGSGERLAWLVRDPRLNKDPDKSDPGAEDRRLLLQEPELARLLTAINREGSTLSAYLRTAFDGKPLINEVKRDASRASIHQIGMIGHSTVEELRDQLTETQIRNGLANRIAWFLARPDKKLAYPPVFEGDEIHEAATELQSKLTEARAVRRLSHSPEARKIWEEWYVNLPEDLGVMGAITARAPALVVRFSVIYALTDGLSTIETDHLRAALALWDFSVRCAAYIWGSTTGDLFADRILEELAYGPLIRTQISNDVFSRNAPAYAIERAGRLLERRGLIARERVAPGQAGGRPAEQWRRTNG